MTICKIYKHDLVNKFETTGSVLDKKKQTILTEVKLDEIGTFPQKSLKN